MAVMIPEIQTDFNDSAGEACLFRVLKGLPEDVTVIHSFRWIASGKQSSFSEKIGRSQGEGDFVVLDPNRGILVVEVKDGDIRCENGIWFQKNRHTGREKPINPEAQSNRTKFRILEEVSRQLPGGNRVLFGHAVWFTSGVVSDRACLPINYHSDLTLDESHIPNAETAINNALDFWKRQHKHLVPPKELTNSIRRLLCPTFSIVPSVRRRLGEQDQALIQMTREQVRVVEFLDEQMHAAIVGPAGTGKTLIAVEKARRIAGPNQPVLFLCYNSALKEHLAKNHTHPNVAYRNFHGLAVEIAGRHGSLEEAVRTLLDQLCDGIQLPYQHVIIDEAQDFERDWLELLRAQFADGAFYVFYDPLQAVQSDRDTRWLDQMPCRLSLTRNCRNTTPIAKLAYRTVNLIKKMDFVLEGPRPTLFPVSSKAEAHELVDRLTTELINAKGIEPHEITLLTLGSVENGEWNRDRIGGFKTAVTPTENCVTVSTVRRFKGLESQVVIVADADFSLAGHWEWRMLMYIACSRARNQVFIVTTTCESQLNDAIKVFTETEKGRVKWRTLTKRLGLKLGDKGDA